MTDTPDVTVLLTADDLRVQLATDAVKGLAATPKSLPPTWFYDDAGCDLFDQITRLPEYYPTRTETAILHDHADDIAAQVHCPTVIELGSGTSEKTAILLRAFERAGTLRRFVPFDVAESTLRDAVARLAQDRPQVSVHGVVGDFRTHLGDLMRVTAGSARLVVFLGGTIGNLNHAERHQFLTTLRESMTGADRLLLATDLVKAPQRLVAAYDDAAGVTAAFNRNLIHVLNRELGGNLAPDVFEHVARWNEREARIEMWLRATRPMLARLAAIDLDLDFAAGEELLTELSCKFTDETIASELAGAGFTPLAAWSDPAGDFRLTLAAPVAPESSHDSD